VNHMKRKHSTAAQRKYVTTWDRKGFPGGQHRHLKKRGLGSRPEKGQGWGGKVKIQQYKELGVCGKGKRGDQRLTEVEDSWGESGWGKVKPMAFFLGPGGRQAQHYLKTTRCPSRCPQENWAGEGRNANHPGEKGEEKGNGKTKSKPIWELFVMGI